ncbi:hypothetical protein GVB51_004935 [Salmonella enterica]|nr:hypothetical protein [Salmonella enterica]EDX4186913.1 hypothetical protein [Salmonella enterica subsp. enterica serovar 4,[5],12:i:-]EDR5051647.1 hypothetical protein [Salmonella enterica]EDS1261633.1 hypothetical protein [Salmonella enterica]EDS2065961.1 hypothetical protein [Salmonella enterica]
MSVDFCDARQGGGAYGKTASSQPFTVVLFCPHVLSWLSPDSVGNLSAVMREPPPLAAAQRPNVVSEWARKRNFSARLL